MIFNLYEYITGLLPTETFKINIKYEETTSPSLPDRLVRMKEYGGVDTAWFKYIRQSVQFISRDVDPVRARQLAYSIDSLLDNKFGLILPSVTVNGVAYPSIQVAQISRESVPQSIGEDANGRAEFSTNYRVIYSQ